MGTPAQICCESKTAEKNSLLKKNCDNPEGESVTKFWCHIYTVEYHLFT